MKRCLQLLECDNVLDEGRSRARGNAAGHIALEVRELRVRSDVLSPNVGSTVCARSARVTISIASHAPLNVDGWCNGASPSGNGIPADPVAHDGGPAGHQRHGATMWPDTANVQLRTFRPNAAMVTTLKGAKVELES